MNQPPSAQGQSAAPPAGSGPPAGVGRRAFLFGGAAGLAAGTGGLLAAKSPGWRWDAKSGQAPYAEGDGDDPPLPEGLPEGTRLSYAQFGDDLVAAGLLDMLGVRKPTYLDVGAWEPIRKNNTYLFYRRGARGVLVEPNVALSEKIRKERPRDTLLVAGIGIEDAELDFYVLDCDELNTFDRDQVERLEKAGAARVVQVVKMPLIRITRVFDEHFGGTAPDLLSIDIEGLDYAVLKSMDFAKYRPKVICVETLVTATLRHNPRTPELLIENGYELRGMTYPNMFFVDRRLLPANTGLTFVRDGTPR